MQKVNTSDATNRQTKGPAVAPDSVLTDLKQRFVEFRAQNARFSPIPETLRQAVFDVLELGIAPSAVRRHCGVTLKQVRQWEKERREAAEGIVNGNEAGCPAVAECFTVVPVDEADQDSKTRVPLEFRVGCWAITIRGLGN